MSLLTSLKRSNVETLHVSQLLGTEGVWVELRWRMDRGWIEVGCENKKVRKKEGKKAETLAAKAYKRRYTLASGI
jgi:hypothetical protein